MELNPKGGAASRSATPGFPHFCGTRRFITAFTACARSIQSVSLYDPPTYVDVEMLTFIGGLCSHDFQTLLTLLLVSRDRELYLLDPTE
jgi:hypothetical protein